MVRIIETTKTDGNFARDVTKYNNTQNKILEQDFYANDRIAEIKNEEDAISRAKYEEKHTSSRKEMADTRMSELIKKAMEVR